MLFYVNKPNPYFKKGTYIRKFDDGWEEAVMQQEARGRAKIAHYRGLIIPTSVDMTRFALPLHNGYVRPEDIHKQRRMAL